jgi:hypothetical protein
LWILPTNDASTSSYYDWDSGSDYPLPTTDPATGQAYTNVSGYNGGYIPSFIEHKGAANTFVGPDGELLFFIVGNNIFDYQGRTIFTNYTQNYPDLGYGKTEIAVVPDPGNCNRYYIFSNLYDNAVYLHLDISLQPPASSNAGWYFGRNPSAKGAIIDYNGTGVNILSNQFPSLDTKPLSIEYAVSEKDAEGNYNLFLVRANGDASNNYLFTYKISPTGVTFVEKFPIVSQVYGKQITVFKYNRSELEVIKTNNNTYRVVTSASDRIAMLEVSADLTSLVGVQSKIFHQIIYGPQNVHASVSGIEFSPNGRYVYFTHETSSDPNLFKNNIHCWDLQTNTFVNLPWQDVLNSEFQYSFIEKYNDKLYMVNQTNMAEISNVNAPSSSIIDQNYLSINYIPNYHNIFGNNLFFSDKRYVLPDQIDNYDYTNIPLDPLCCLNSVKFDVETFTANTSENPNFTNTTQVWTPTNNPLNGGTGPIVTIRNSIDIPAGFKVSIVGMQLQFHPEAEINVRRGDGINSGGELIIENSLLTSHNQCTSGLFWQGIDVEGFYNQPQLPWQTTQQGKLVVKNKSSIEYAIVGAEALQENNGIYNPSQAGGIIYSNHATWRNNKIDIKITNYLYNNNASNIWANTFVTDQYLPELEQVRHVFLLSVKGVKLQGNDFKNDAFNLYSENKRGFGVFAANSQFMVNPANALNGNVIDCHFNNLTYGVVGLSGNVFYNSKVDKCNFYNNQYGVYFDGMQSSIVTRNNIEIAENSLNYKTSGIYFSNCTGYKVEENILKSDQSTTYNGNTYGIVINNSGTNDNFVYKNTLFDLTIGCQSSRTNGTPGNSSTNNSSHGLKWQCNKFIKNIEKSDIALTSGLIDYQQGLSAGINILPQYAGARNLFSHDVPVSNNQYDITVNPIPSYVSQGIDYSYYPSYSLTEPQAGNYTEYLPGNPYTHVSLTSATSPIFNFDYTQSCPSKIIEKGTTPISLGDDIVNLKQTINEVKANLATYNQQTLLDVINNGSMSNGQLKNLLISNAPMISDMVLISYIQSNPPTGHLLQVLFSVGALSNNVIQILSNSNALPNFWINLLSTYYVGTSPYNQILNNLDYLEAIKERTIDEYIAYYMLIDTTVVNPIDSVINILSAEESKFRKQQLVDAYIFKKEIVTAEIKNNALIQAYGYDNFNKLTEQRIANAYGACMITNINSDSTSKAVVEQVVADSSLSFKDSYKAKCFLYENLIKEEYYLIIEDLVNFSNGSSNKISASYSDDNLLNDQIILDTYADVTLKLYPNPANDNVNIKVEGLLSNEKTIIEVVDIYGKVIYSNSINNINLSIDLSNISSGIYFVLVRNQKQIIKTEKLIIE